MTPQPLFSAVIDGVTVTIFSDRVSVRDPDTTWDTCFSADIVQSGRCMAWIEITREMMAEAARLVSVTQMTRTRATDHDAFLGHIGELAWSVHRYGTHARHQIGCNFGQADDGEVEVKISAVDLKQGHHLKIREDYVARAAKYYVQMFLDGGTRGTPPKVGQRVIIAGYILGDEVHRHGHWTRDGSGDEKFSTLSVPVRCLQPLSDLDRVLGIGGAA